MERIMGALMFRQGVYEEVENDPAFTPTAWAIVAVTAFLSQLGLNAANLQGEGGVVGWLLGTIIGTVFALLGFALACIVVVAVGKTLFQATATFEEMVRTLGLAYIWNVVGLIAIVGAVLPFLALLSTPILCVASLLGLAASAVALKAALDLDWGKTIITAIIAFVVLFVLNFIAGAILGALGYAASAAPSF